MPNSEPKVNSVNVESVLEKDFVVQSYETDPRGFARPVALLNYLQSAAGEHAAQLHVAVADLRTGGHTWVLSRIHLAMGQYPRGGHTVRLKTWPATRENLFTARDFELYDSAGVIIGRATTSWAVLNIATRRPVKLGTVLPEYPIKPQRALFDNFTTLPAFENSDHDLRLPVLRGDLDVNRHVNNTVYAGWALETVPEEIDSMCCLADLEISFRAEALYGDTIVARLAQTAETGCYLHRIESSSDGRELARLRTRWLPLSGHSK